MRAADFYLRKEPPIVAERRDQSPQRVCAGMGVEAVHHADAPAKSAEIAGLTIIANEDETAVIGAVAARCAVARRSNQLHAARETIDQVVAAALTDQKLGVDQHAERRQPTG